MQRKLRMNYFVWSSDAKLTQVSIEPIRKRLFRSTNGEKFRIFVKLQDYCNRETFEANVSNLRLNVFNKKEKKQIKVILSFLSVSSRLTTIFVVFARLKNVFIFASTF